jgi:Rps23 Pro-64 3,4-dihydroxylase Tpa1-like proline 4-hydroxylase
MKLLYVEDDFITADQAKDIIQFYKKNVHRTFEYHNTYPLDIADHYHNEYPLNTIVDKISRICKGFVSDIELDNTDIQIVRRVINSSMEYHTDKPGDKIQFKDVLAGVLYLNDNYSGGSTGFESFQVEPKLGRLIVFSNSYYRHCVNEVRGDDRYTLATWFFKRKN